MADTRGPMPTGQNRSLSPLERARSVSQALADAARRARLSSRSRRHLAGGGFQGRRGAGTMRLVFNLTFWLLAVAPAAAAIAYYGFIASDQFISEVKFTISGGEPVMPDGISALSGIPSVTIIQDTQIVTNFLESRAAVEQLQEKLDIRERFSGQEIDWFARFNAKKPIEKLVRYWKGMTEVSILLPAGIVSFKVRAFSADDAKAIAQAALDLSETLINDLNARIYHDAVRSGEAEVQRASTRLLGARISLEKARNEEGILDIGATTEALNKLMLEIRSASLKMQQEYVSQLKSVTEDAPQMRNLRARINAANAQIAEIEAKMTRTKASISDDSLAQSMTRFALLDLERQIAERLYAGAVSTLELARISAERKRMYLNTFVQPALAQEARYPRRGLMIFLVSLGSLASWGTLIGLITFVRNHMA